jgi:hypothetical protein
VAFAREHLIPIVRSAWVAACVQAHTWVPEGPYLLAPEDVDDTNDNNGGPPAPAPTRASAPESAPAFAINMVMPVVIGAPVRPAVAATPAVSATVPVPAPPLPPLATQAWLPAGEAAPSANLYLSGCVVYVSATVPDAVRADVRRTVTLGGGTRAGHLNSSVTHVVAGAWPLSPGEQQARASMAATVQVVSPAWLAACYYARAAVPIGPFLFVTHGPPTPSAADTRSEDEAAPPPPRAPLVRQRTFPVDADGLDADLQAVASAAAAAAAAPIGNDSHDANAGAGAGGGTVSGVSATSGVRATALRTAGRTGSLQLFDAAKPERQQQQQQQQRQQEQEQQQGRRQREEDDEERPRAPQRQQQSGRPPRMPLLPRMRATPPAALVPAPIASGTGTRSEVLAHVVVFFHSSARRHADYRRANDAAVALGAAVRPRMDASVTHVVVWRESMASRRYRTVSLQWLLDCDAQGRRLDAGTYPPMYDPDVALPMRPRASSQASRSSDSHTPPSASAGLDDHVLPPPVASVSAIAAAGSTARSRAAPLATAGRRTEVAVPRTRAVVSSPHPPTPTPAGAGAGAGAGAEAGEVRRGGAAGVSEAAAAAAEMETLLQRLADAPTPAAAASVVPTRAQTDGPYTHTHTRYTLTGGLACL